MYMYIHIHHNSAMSVPSPHILVYQTCRYVCVCVHIYLSYMYACICKYIRVHHKSAMSVLST